MSDSPELMPAFLFEPSRLGREITVTGKWTPSKPGGLFRKSAESHEMLAEWEDIHADGGSHYTAPGGTMSEGTTD